MVYGARDVRVVRADRTYKRDDPGGRSAAASHFEKNGKNKNAKYTMFAL